MKRILAALLALGLLFSAALAQEEGGAIASYRLPDGAQVFYLPLGEAPEAVKGLEPLYELMTNASMRGDVYLLQMAGGHALASVSCIPVGRTFTADDLLARWPQIAQAISLEALAVDASAECATVEKLHGVELLHIQTTIAAGDEGAPLALKAEAFAFSQNGAVTEIWLVHPEADSFAGDQQLLEKDVAALAEFEQSLTFPGGDFTLLNGMPYEDLLGRFVMMVPADGAVIDSATTQEAIAQIRERFIAANPEGADRVFDKLISYVAETDSVVIFSGDMQGVIEVTGNHMPELVGMSAEKLSMMANSIEENMALEYDFAACMTASERMWLSNQEHALMGYWLRMGETDLQLDLMVCMMDGWLYEADVYSVEGNQDARTTMHAFTSQSLIYTPPVNALD